MSDQAVKREKVASTSGEVVADQVAKLKAIFPECISEGKLDFAKLHSTLGEAVG